ncbi:MAG TPA: orotidine-5'-phosphate decarboxylase [Bacteriovoracaceae bacterium]|nr:orotidine-5'-phosphate decarboxylase [Bacteriovoracaceae bacterium]
MISPTKVIVALDTQDPAKLAKLFVALSGYPVWVKLGMEVFYSIGPKVIHEAKDKGFKIFLDLKLHDIPNTVEQGLKSLMRYPVDMINIHAAGGSEMMRRASDAVKAKADAPLLIAVTQLTSTTQSQMNNEQCIPDELTKNVMHLSRLAREAGCDGVVASPLEVKGIREICGPDFKIVTPGIRPKGSEALDQKRYATPNEAILLGSDFLVIGRPITGDPEHRLALEKILKGN